MRLTTDKLDLEQFNARFPKIQPKYVDVVVDSGAQSCLWSRSAFLKRGFCKDDLIPVSQSLRDAIEHVETQEHDNVNAVDDDVYAPCGCFKRELPPEKPEELPFDCVPDNAERMKEWLFRRYASSTFNKCKHQKLPEMKGPPIQIHVNPDAKPVRFTKPVPVPLHLRDQVEQPLMMMWRWKSLSVSHMVNQLTGAFVWSWTRRKMA